MHSLEICASPLSFLQPVFATVQLGLMTPSIAPAMLTLATIISLITGSALAMDTGVVCSIVAPSDTVLCAGSLVKVSWSTPSPVRAPMYLSTAAAATRYPLQLGANHGERVLSLGDSSDQRFSIVNDAGNVLCQTLVSARRCKPCQPNSDKVEDACGVCGGQSDCVGCDGSAFSRKRFDRCGVCGGADACPKLVSNGALDSHRISRHSSERNRSLQQVSHSATPPVSALLTLFYSKMSWTFNGTKKPLAMMSATPTPPAPAL